MTEARSRRRISCSAPAFLGRELEHVTDCLERGWITQGRYAQRAEELLAAVCTAQHAIVCSSGTAALHLALIGLELKPRDVVIVPALTYVATANAVTYCGAEVAFCDVYADTWTIDYADAGRVAREMREAGRNVVGVLPVDLYGMLPDIGRLRATDGLEDLWLLEDAAEAIGAQCPMPRARAGLEVRRAGSLGDAGVLSFYGNKIITAGEGGCVLTDDERIADRVRLYRGQGARTPGVYKHDVIGYNYRITDLQAAVLVGQLETHQQHARARRRLGARYHALLDREELSLDVQLQRRELTDLHVQPVDWLMPVLLHDEDLRRRAQRELAARGIETRPFFTPLPLDAAHYAGYVAERFRNSVELWQRGLCLPLHVGMTDDDVDYVVENLLEVIR